jgi:hypothetical protein
MTLRGTYTYMVYICIYMCAYIVAVTAQWLCMSLAICIVFSSCSYAPCAGTMQCMCCSQSSSSVAWAGQAGKLWPEPVVLL